jgi:hypothetical protein
MRGQIGGANADKNCQITSVRYPQCPTAVTERLCPDDNLALVVEPAQVRLITTSDDQYSWKVLPGKEHLFRKQLSKHSTGAYMELFREVGASFEAVPATGETTKQSDGGEGSATFSGKIEELERHKLSLIRELCECKSRVERAENEIDQLRATIVALKQQGVQRTELIDYYRRITVKSLEDANSAFEKFRLSALASKRDRGWSDLLEDASSCSPGDEEWISLDLAG